VRAARSLMLWLRYAECVPKRSRSCYPRVSFTHVVAPEELSIAPPSQGAVLPRIRMRILHLK
jgi:hypothetical protein